VARVSDRNSPSGAGAVRAERWSPGRIGELVALHRQRRSLRVSELARLVGVTPSLISQIERGNSRPSVATLFALAEALDVSVDVFADREGPGRPSRPSDGAEPAAAPRAAQPGQRFVVRKGERRSLTIEGGIRWEMLTPSPSPSIEFLELVYEGQAQSSPTLYTHPGVEMVLVLAGRLDIHLGFDVYELGEGDSISFPSSLPHRYVNPTGEPSRAVTVILHDAAAASPL
jgi:transcriptional regulator with XRE-family HTH domain